jgi:hypothetical protein
MLKHAPKGLAVLLLAALTTFSHCSCPDDVVLGKLAFQTDMWPFQGGEEFTFVNANGEEISFIGSTANEVQSSPLIMEENCSTLTHDSQVTYYDRELLSFEYRLNTSVYLSYFYMIRNAVIPSSHVDTVLYETFEARFVNTIWTVNSTTDDYLSLLVSDRGNSLTSDITTMYDDFKVISDTTLNGVHYHDLICQRKNAGVFYSKIYGIVSFNYNEDWWYLKEVNP